MTPESTVSVERAIGRMETAITDTHEQVGTLTTTLAADFRDLKLDIANLWATVRVVQQEMMAERGARETVLADARAARETLAAAAAIAQTKTAQDATETAATKTAFEEMRAQAVEAAAEAAKAMLATAAEAAKRTIVTETGERREQRHWFIERILPILVGVGLAILTFLLAGGQIGQ